MHKNAQPVFVGTTDGANALGLSRNGFQNNVRKGILPQPKRLGRRNLWELAELIEAVRACRGDVRNDVTGVKDRSPNTNATEAAAYSEGRKS